MKKIIGKYKDEDIFINSMHIEYTYAGTACGFTKANKYVVEKEIPDHCARNFGDAPIHIVGKESLDYSEHFPENIVYAHIMTCCPYCGNSLILVWFQNDDKDFFEEAKKGIEGVGWEEESTPHLF